MGTSRLNIDWGQAFKPLLKKYANEKPSLNYHSIYELMVMVVLAAQSSDDLINEVTPAFFKKYPNIKSLSEAQQEDLLPYLSKVRNFYKKANWLLKIAQTLKHDKNIPVSMDELVALKGIGRKSANVIMRGAKVEAEGIIATYT